jgi:hypothetical protein
MFAETDKPTNTKDMNTTTSPTELAAVPCSETFEWIRAALAGGGTLSVRAPFPGKSIFHARMTWPSSNPLTGNISTSVLDALRNLEGTLKHDAESQNEKSPSTGEKGTTCTAAT